MNRVGENSMKRARDAKQLIKPDLWPWILAIFWALTLLPSASGQNSGLVGYWPMDNTGTNAVSGVSATVNGTFVAGHRNQALSGSASTGEFAQLYLGNRTITAWFYGGPGWYPVPILTMS